MGLHWGCGGAIPWSWWGYTGDVVGVIMATVEPHWSYAGAKMWLWCGYSMIVLGLLLGCDGVALGLFCVDLNRSEWT